MEAKSIRARHRVLSDQHRASCVGFLKALAFLLLLPHLSAEKPARKESFHWPAWKIPATKLEAGSALSIVEDEEAESIREFEEDGEKKKSPSALQIRVSRRSIAKGSLGIALTPEVKWKSIVPGVYRLQARVKFSGETNVIGTPIRLTASVPRARLPNASEDFHNFDIGEEDTWQTISLIYEIDQSLRKRLAARKPRHSWHYSHYLKEIYPEYEPKVGSKRKPPGLKFGIVLPRTKYSSFSGDPPNSVRTVSVDWVKLERIQPSKGLTVRYLRAEKRWIRPGAEQNLHILVENFTGQSQTRALVVALENEFNTRKELYRQNLTLDAGTQKAVSVPWKTSAKTKLWGYKAVAETLAADGAIESSAFDVFSLHPEVYVVHLMGARSRHYDPFKEHENLANLVEVFAATAGDCARILPKEDQWLCGMSIVPQSYKIVRGATDYNRSIGVSTHMYLFAGGTGNALMDLYIRKPEYLGSRLVATDQVYRIRKASMDAVRKHDFSTGPFDMPKTPHIEEHLNHWFPELMDQITNEAVEFVKRTGYEGIRFDVGIFGPQRVHSPLGIPLPFKNEEKMKHAAKNFDQFKDALRKAYPDFEFGANMDTWAYLERVGRRDEEAPPPEDFPEFIAFAKAGGMFMDEGTMSAPLFNHYMNRYEDAIWGICEKRKVARKYNGVYQLFSPHRNGRGHFAHDDIYWAIFTIASGSYYVGNFSAAPFCEDSPGVFITRFSEFFRSKDLVPIPEAEDAIYVDSPEILWYADTAVQAKVGDKLRYVIPLINPPITERFRRNKTNELPPPVDEPFPIEVNMPEGYTRARATMLTWEPRTMAKELKVEIADDVVKVEFPGIKLFRTLVVEFEK